MSKKYDLGQLDKRVVDAFKSKSKNDFMLWARKELKPLELAEVAHDAITGLSVVAPAIEPAKKSEKKSTSKKK